MLDVADRADGFLERIGDALLDVLDSRALVDRADLHDRQIDVRKQIDRQAPQRHDAEDDDGQRQHQDGNRVPKRQEGQPHRYFSVVEAVPSSEIRTRLPSWTNSLSVRTICVPAPTLARV